MKPRVIFLLLICTASSFAQNGSYLKLNEIMFYPASGNNEFIEIYNTDTQSIDLDDFKIKYYNSTADIISDAGEGTILNPLSYAVLFEGDYDLLSGIYKDLVPPEALILRIEDNYFGSTGMANTSDRPVFLLSPDDDTLDVYTYSANNLQTLSDEKIIFGSDSSQVNWNNSIFSNGTPGFRNSVTPVSFNLGISSISISPGIPQEGDNLLITAIIKNYGENSADDFTVTLFNDINLDSIPQGSEQIYSQEYFSLTAGDSISVYADIISAEAGYYNIIAIVYFPADEDTSNNTALKSFIVYPRGTGYNDVVINEIMYAPSGEEPEWVEIYNRTTEDINLKGWSISDNISTKIITDDDFILPVESFVVITRDSSILNFYQVPSPIIKLILPTLNNTGDAVVIKDSLEIMIDSISYSPDWGGNTGGKSLERISPDIPGTLQTSWSTSESIFKATPGKINSITPKNNDLRISAFEPATEYGILGEPVQFNIQVKNSGLSISPSFSISLFRDLNCDSIPQYSEMISTINSVPILPGDSILLNLSSFNNDEGSNYFIARMVCVPDDDTTNNTAFANVTIMRVNEIRNDLIINEIMYDPDAPQPEWIEVLNRSDKLINFKNYKIADTRDTTAVCTEDLFITPGTYAVIAKDSTIKKYFSIPSHLVIHSFSALNNTGDIIILLDSLNRVIDSLEYSSGWGGNDGISLERINSESPPTTQENWLTSISRNHGTPGFINSVTQKDFDISVDDIRSFPVYPAFGDDVLLNIIVKNPGYNAANYSLKLYRDTNLDSIPDVLLKTITGLSLQPGDSSVVESGYTAENLLSPQNYYASAEFNADMDTSNNHIIKNILPGYSPFTIVINEIMFTPSGGEPEWVELFNTSTDSISLQNWTINDVVATPAYAVIKPHYIIPPQGYIVISRDSSITNYHRLIPSPIIVLNLPVLNNDNDGFVLKDSRGQMMDSVYFYHEWGGADGHSLERAAVKGPSNLSVNWGSSDDIELSTPGRINSITAKERDVTIIKITSDPEFPVDGDNVFIAAIVKNKGSEPASGIITEFYIDSDSDNVADKRLSSNAGISLNPDDSLFIISADSIKNLSAGLLTAVKVIYAEDEDTLNNYAERIIQPGFANKTVLVNEIMYDPSTGEPEWFEIINNSSDSINLKDWSASDLLTTPSRNFITGSDFYLHPQQFAVIAKDTSIYSKHPGIENLFITNFGTLGNTEDGIILYDFRDAVIDSLRYKTKWGGKEGYSLERISVSEPTCDSSNWTTSLSPGKSTPGKE
ncbi:MAG TPA: lamin tail domain-containing protein, partial [Ignavibacteriaceae bacterium]|nr:lamin tail domain-containing protein [Ignavibacteriaceae bacterium]